MEKLGAIKSAADFGVAAVLRNKFAHHYPEESRDQIDKLNSLIREAAFVSGVFDSITTYIENKRLLSRDDEDGVVAPASSVRCSDFPR